MLDRTRAAPVPDRNAYLRSLAAGRRVLDIGVVDHMPARAADDDWLHKSIVDVAAYCLGVDVLAEGVEQLRRKGYNARVCDVTTSDPGERFDLVICGEVAEHLGSPGALFSGAARCLLPGGRLVITSPNPHYLPRIRDALLGRVEENVDHVTYLFPSGVAELAERAGLRLLCWRGVRQTSPRTLFGRLAFAAWRALDGVVASEVDCYTFVYECARAEDA